MTLTGVIYFLLLRGLEEQLQIPVPWVNTVLHYVIPAVVLVLADWLAVLPPRTVRVREALVWVLFPALYVPYSLIRGGVVVPLPVSQRRRAGLRECRCHLRGDAGRLDRPGRAARRPNTDRAAEAPRLTLLAQLEPLPEPNKCRTPSASRGGR